MGATEHGVELAPLTTMRVGGPADTLVTAETLDEVVAAVRAADEAGTPLLLLSGGSNLVIADDGFRGTVVRIATKGVRVESTHDEHVDVVVAAGEVWDDVVARAVAEGWSGIEALSGIPGLAGATPVLCLPWMGFTYIGATAGSLTPAGWPLDFAVPITFLAMIAPMLRTLAHVAAAGVAIVTALLLAGLPSGTNVLVAGPLGMVTGAVVEGWSARRRLRGRV